MTDVIDPSNAPVRKSITVNTSPARAFTVFTEAFDSWWPRGHHIGKGVLQTAVIETRAGGRCYGRETDGTECPWGTVTVWEPPHRVIIAWQISAQWQFEPDPTKASEVEIQFIPIDGGTRVDLEHRHFERMGAGGEAMRTGVAGDGGWGSLLNLFKAAAEQG